VFSGNALKTTILLAALTGLLLLVGDLIGGRSGLVIAMLLALVMNFGSYFFSDRIALAMGGAKEISYEQAPELHDVVREVAQASGMPMPRVAIVQADAPNAFATGRDPNHAVVAVTTGILRLLDRRELRGVLAHELGHVRNRDILVSAIAATVAGAISFLAQMAQWSLWFGGFGGRSDDEREGGGGALGLVGMLLAMIRARPVRLGPWLGPV
jgi:heat shock protein HtpX